MAKSLRRFSTSSEQQNHPTQSSESMSKVDKFYTLGSYEIILQTRSSIIEPFVRHVPESRNLEIRLFLSNRLIKRLDHRNSAISSIEHTHPFADKGLRPGGGKSDG